MKTKRTKKCVICKKLFTLKGPYHISCSDKCRKIRTANKRLEWERKSRFCKSQKPKFMVRLKRFIKAFKNLF